MSADNSLRGIPSAAAGADDPYITRPLVAHEITGQADANGDTPTLLRRREKATPPQRKGGAVLSAILLVLTLLVVGIGGGLYYLDQMFKGKIYPNVTVQGLSLGQMSRDEAEAAIRARYEPFLNKPVTLTFGDQTWQPTASDVGLSFDFASAADAAYEAGRSNGLLENVQQVLAIWQNGLDLPLHVSLDQQQMAAYVNKVGADLEVAPADAQLVRNGLDISTVPARVGRQVLVDETVRGLNDALSSLTTQDVAIRTRDLQPRLLDDQVAAAKTQLDTLLQGPITLKVKDETYTWTPEEINRMVSVAQVPQTDGTDTLTVSINDAIISRRLDDIATTVREEPTLPRVAWNGGNLKITKEGTPGVQLDAAQAQTAVLAALNGSQRDISLPLTELDPVVNQSNLNTLGINELVGLGQSDFKGSAAYRIHNIGAGMELLQGILIPPGEEFSFNNTIGEIDEAHGFVEGYAIVSNRTQLEFGGGICQDSTTVFRAAFWAGLPFTEWRGHQYYISWYDKYAYADYGNGAGMDATIFTGPGGQDLRFLNDTGNWLLLQASSNNKTAVAAVALYGTKVQREVSVERTVSNRIPAIAEPVYVADRKQPVGTMKQTDTARGGMTVEVVRTIVENGQTRQDVFRTKYAAWPNIYAVNPADIGSDGKPVFLHKNEPTEPETTTDAGTTTDPNAQPATTDSNAAADSNAQPTPAPADAGTSTDPNATADPNVQPTPAPADPNAETASNG